MSKNVSQPSIKIDKVSDDKIFKFASGWIGEMNKKFSEIQQVITSVNIVVVLSLVAIIIALIGLFLDQMRFNSVTYKEYSQKTESVDITQKTNEVLLRNIEDLYLQSKEDREIIKELLNR